MADLSSARADLSSFLFTDLVESKSLRRTARADLSSFLFTDLVESKSLRRTAVLDALINCARAVDDGDRATVDRYVEEIKVLASHGNEATRKVAAYFSEALARRIYDLHPPNPLLSSFLTSPPPSVDDAVVGSPFLIFPYTVATAFISQNFTCMGHFICFSITRGFPWGNVISKLPRLAQDDKFLLRLTVVGPPLLDDPDYYDDIGREFEKATRCFSDRVNYESLIVNNLDEIDVSKLKVEPTIRPVVISMFQLHKLLARSGALEKVLAMVRSINPIYFLVVEQEVNLNIPDLLPRFKASLLYYYNVFESLENNRDKMFWEVCFRRQIGNVVACEGEDRVERHQSLSQWESLFTSAGFRRITFSLDVHLEAYETMERFRKGGYRVSLLGDPLMLSWHEHPLIVTSNWELGYLNFEFELLGGKF